MTGIRFFLDRRYAAGVIVGLSVFLSFDLADWIQGLAEKPTTMVDLAGEQLQSCFLVGVVGAGLGALLTARHLRHAGEDYWGTATRSPLQLSGIRFAAAALPVLTAWLVFVVLSSAQLGPGGHQGLAVAVLAMSFTAAAVGSALGQVIATLLPWVLAVPAAVVVSYVGVLAVSGAGDDYWWGWLVPAFGDGLDTGVYPLWIIGEAVWFVGLTLALLVLAAWLTSRPRLIPLTATVVAVGLLLAGGTMLYLNGEDATADPPTVAMSTRR